MQLLLPAFLSALSPLPLKRLPVLPLSRFFSARNNSNSECPFRVLGLTPDASAAALRLRYLQLAKKLHPDAAFPEFDSKTSGFIELRKAYEQALQMQKQSQCLNSPQKEEASSPRTGRGENSAQETMILREWERQLKERSEFWAKAKHAEQRRAASGEDVFYQQQMLERFQSKLAMEKKCREFKNTINEQQKDEDVLEAAAREKAEAEAWEEHQKELRAFGLETNRSSWATQYLYTKPADKLSKSGEWISREANKQNGWKGRHWKPVVAAGAVLVVVAAATGRFYNREECPEKAC